MSVTDERNSTGTRPAGDAARGSVARLGSPWNIPNLITFARLILAVFLFGLIDAGGHWLAACFVFIIAAATDAIDGYIARKYGLVTVVGRILDPFVDKVIIGGAFVFLAAVPDSGINPWMAMIVMGREMFITGLRSFLESEGRDFSATWSGKIKMIVQCVAVSASLLYLEYCHGTSWRSMTEIPRDVILWSAVAATVFSGVIYVVRAVQMFRAG
jgi:CDP-diacylglycerol---glycerol-3-phosphate 3-phosphatidyltransferase